METRWTIKAQNPSEILRDFTQARPPKNQKNMSYIIYNLYGGHISKLYDVFR